MTTSHTTFDYKENLDRMKELNTEPFTALKDYFLSNRKSCANPPKNYTPDCQLPTEREIRQTLA